MLVTVPTTSLQETYMTTISPVNRGAISLPRKVEQNPLGD